MTYPNPSQLEGLPSDGGLGLQTANTLISVQFPAVSCSHKASVTLTGEPQTQTRSPLVSEAGHPREAWLLDHSIRLSGTGTCADVAH